MTIQSIIQIVSIILLIRIIFLIIGHLIIVFYDKATKTVVDKIQKDIKAYVRNEHMAQFMYDAIWLYIFIQIAIAAFNNNITINI